MMRLKHIFLLLVTAGFTSACYNDNLQELTPSAGLDSSTMSCDTAGIMTYATNVTLILKTYCGTQNSCHSSSNTSGVNLSTYNGVRTVALDGRLINSIKWTGSAEHMPQNSSKLSDCTIKKIEKWVNAGALNN